MRRVIRQKESWWWAIGLIPDTSKEPKVQSLKVTATLHCTMEAQKVLVLEVDDHSRWPVPVNGNEMPSVAVKCDGYTSVQNRIAPD